MINTKLKYSFFACDFETTYSKEEIENKELLKDNRFLLMQNQADKLCDEMLLEKKSAVFLSGIYSINTGKYKLCYENLAETFNHLAYQTIKERHYRALVFYHNLQFDGSFILNWLLKHKWKQTLKQDEKTFKPLLGHKEFHLLLSGGKFFRLTFKWKGTTLIFVDSLKILPQSIETLGELIGYKKLNDDIDYKQFKINKQHNYPQKWLDYLKRDCEILAKILEHFFINEELKLKSLTIGSISYSHIKSIIADKTKGFNIKDFIYFNQWYRGGLCFPSMNYFAKWAYKPNKIKMVDACSMYPSQMIKPLPSSLPQNKINKEWKQYCTYYEIEISYANIKPEFKDIAILPKPYKYFGLNKKICLLDENGDIVDYPYEYLQTLRVKSIYHFVDIEWDLIKKLYDVKFKIKKKWYCELTPYLNEAVSDMFIEKQNAKNDTSRLIAKLKLNNLYGKISQKPIRSQDFYGSEKDIDNTKYKILSKKNLMFEAYNIEEIKDENKPAQPVFIGAYITASARVCLINKYLEIKKQKGTFLYCDTDSICYYEAPNKPINFNDIGNKLGCWEFEKNKATGGMLVADGFCCLAPKQYRLVIKNEAKPIKFASAGVGKAVMLEVRNQHYNYELTSNILYSIKKKKLKNSYFGKIIDDSGEFTFKKWGKFKKSPVCPKELWN